MKRLTLLTIIFALISSSVSTLVFADEYYDYQMLEMMRERQRNDERQRQALEQQRFFDRLNQLNRG